MVRDRSPTSGLSINLISGLLLTVEVLISSGSLNSHLVITSLSGIESAAITLVNIHVGL